MVFIRIIKTLEETAEGRLVIADSVWGIVVASIDTDGYIEVLENAETVAEAERKASIYQR